MAYDLRVGSEHAFKDARLMQFTGLKDKNGKEIYEWDILSCKIAGTGAVTWNEVGCRDFGIIANPIHSEVIGNIYENPELLPR